MEVKEQRGQWGSKFGFIMAAAGSAVGLGNLWKFPYLAGRHGGGIFLIVYLIIIVFLGYSMMLGEMSIGRHTKLNQYNAYRTINKKWGAVGFLGILTPFLILSFYTVVGGWVMKYLWEYIAAGSIANPGSYFGEYIATVGGPIFWNILFLILTLFIVIGGVSGGIERASVILMPALLFFLVILAIRSVTLPGAGEGIAFYLTPDFSQLNMETWVAAMGQAFFSLSMGMGIMVTYGSYLKGDEDLSQNGVIIPVIDTMVATLAGFVIIPATISFGFDVGQGPGLLFGTLPAIFNQMPLGRLFAILFFLLVLFAALTSSISLLEVPVSWTNDNFGWSRKKSVVFWAILIGAIGMTASLSMGPILGDFKITIFSADGHNFFDFLDYFTSNFMLPLGGFLLCMFITFAWGFDNAIAEIQKGSKSNFRAAKFWKFSIMILVPIMLIVVFLSQLGIL